MICLKTVQFQISFGTWNDPSETNYDSLYELADMSAVDLHKGDTMEVNVLCSKRLPSRTIKVWINDDEDVEYE